MTKNLWIIKSDIRRIIYDEVEVNKEDVNKLMQNLANKLYHLLENELADKLKKNIQTVDPTPLPNCRHQDVPLYYGGNRGINPTDYKMCFKCKKLYYNKSDK